MYLLDQLVTNALIERLLHPERVGLLLSDLAEKRAKDAAAVDERITRLEKEVQDTEERLRRLYRLVEDGHAELDDILRERVAALKADHQSARVAVEGAQSASRSKFPISHPLIENFAATMREKMTGGDVSFRKAYIGAIIDRIEVDHRQVRIIGQKDTLERGILNYNDPAFGVRSFVRKWRPVGESNSCFSRERAAS
jgi:site-specific DNA recombinase